MKYILILISLFFFTLTNAQKINRLGKIETEELPKAANHQVKKIDDTYKVFADSLIFDGNSYFKTPNGYITSLEVVDKEKDYVKQYDANGKLLVTIFSDRIINLKVANNGNKIAYYDTENIILIDLINYTSDTLNGSFAYSFLNDNSFIYYNSEDKSIQYKGLSVDVESYPSQFLEFKNNLLVLCKGFIYKLSGNSLIVLYELKGDFFDAKIIDEEFYFVDKVEERKSEDYTMYKTSDFTKFIIVDILNEYSR